jgi:hypothetical protein
VPASPSSIRTRVAPLRRRGHRLQVDGYAPDGGGDLYPVLVADLHGRPFLPLEVAGEEDLDAHPIGPQHPVDVEPVRRDLLADGPGAGPGSSALALQEE